MKPMAFAEDQNSQGHEPFMDWPSGDKATLAGTAWTPTLPAGTIAADVTNTGAAWVYARGDGQAAVAGHKTTVPIAPGGWRRVTCPGGLSIIGSSGDVFVMPVAQD